jgi:Uma2 family endonuclease
MAQTQDTATPGAILPPAEKMTYEEFLDWLDEDRHAEWVNGEVVFMSPIGDLHQEIGRFLIMLLSHFVEASRLGIIRYVPFQMKTAPDLPGRAPDILFVADANLSRLKKTYLEGPADLAVEIVSPDSGARDRGDKYYEYEQGGVREYWLIDPQRRQAEFYVLDEAGIYRLAPITDGIFRSTVLDGLWLKVDWLWQEPLPPVLSVLKEWGLV